MPTAVSRIRLTLFALAFFGLAGSPSYAQNQLNLQFDYQIVTADETSSTQTIVDEFRKLRTTTEVTPGNIRPSRNGRRIIYIAVGPNALQSLLERNVNGTIIATFTSSEAFRSITDSVNERKVALTAIFADPAPATQMQLISLIFRKQVQVGVILGPKTAHLQPLLAQAAKQTNLVLSVANFTPSQNVYRVVSSLAESQVILSTQDSDIYNGNTLRSILITTYRSNQALVGFSASMVKAGALATTMSEISDIAAQVSEVISDIESNGKVAAPTFPKYFRTVINDSVARSLNIVIDDSAREFSLRPKQPRGTQ